VLTALALFAVLMVLMVPATQAQSSFKATIPFDFAVGNKRLPAGEYQIKPAAEKVMVIQSTDARSSAVAMTIGVQAGKSNDVGKLVFNRYGDQYFLSKIWPPASTDGRELSKSRLEREVAAQSRVKPAATAVAIAK
jgi:hypothetical protein